jgi:lambda family phage portal protein
MGLWTRLRAAASDAFRTDRATGPVYQGAGSGYRFRDLPASSIGPTAAVVVGADTLRNRARALVRNNAWARNACETFVANVVGTGFTPHPLFGIGDEQPEQQAASAAWVKRAKDRFRRWSAVADADGGTFDEIVRLAVRGMFEAGDAFVVRVPGPAVAGVPVQLRVWEAEMLPLWENRELAGGGFIRAGIEFDAQGRRVAYHFERQHPGEFTLSRRDVTLQRIPASEVLHFYRPLRPGQVRGEPFLAPVVLRLHDLGAYSDAEVVRKKSAANFVFAVEAPDPRNVSDSLGKLHDEAALNGQVDTVPGSTFVGGVGETMKVVQAADVGPNFAAFVEKVLHEIAAGVGVTYEMLTGDLSQVNYSSIRAGTLEFRRRCEPIQYGIVAARLGTVWRWFLEAAVTAGTLQAPRWIGWREDYLDCLWVPPGWKWVDPAKEVAAYLDAIAGGLTSRERVIAEQGEDIEQIDVENARAAVREGRLGLAYTPTVSAATRAAATEPERPMAPRRTGTDG